MRRLFKGAAPRAGQGLGTAALAPMVDMLTILLVAILRSWSAEPPLRLPEPGMALPVSAMETPAPRVVTIDVGAEGLYVDGYRSGSATYWVQADDVLITDVHEALKRVGGTAIAIRADEEAPWELVGKVLFTAQQAGYEDIQLVAVSRASL